MKGDFSRWSFDPAKRYTRVLMQQGRMLLDADWNEQNAIVLDRLRTLTRDMVGPHGGPGDGFAISAGDGTDVAIGAGRYYVQGIACECEGASYKTQPGADGSLEDGQSYLAYLEVFEREVSAAEDPTIREAVLGGGDSAARARVEWRVRVMLNDPPVVPENTAAATATPASADIDYDTFLERLTPVDDRAPATLPTLRVRVRGQPTNQLYRVEIHAGGETAEATFQWARDNASVVFPVQEVRGDTVVLAPLPGGVPPALVIGDWVELEDDDFDDAATPHVKVTGVTGATVTVAGSLEDGSGAADRPRSGRRRLRVWQGGAGVDELVEWFTLDDGVEIRLESADPETSEPHFRRGDYWTIPVRVVEGDREDSLGPPRRPARHYAPLATFRVADGQVTKVVDLRRRMQRDTAVAPRTATPDDRDAFTSARRTDDHRIVIFAHDDDAVLRYRQQGTTRDEWTQWKRLGTRRQVGSRPVVLPRPDGGFEIFARDGADQAIGCLSLSGEAADSGWTPVGADRPLDLDLSTGAPVVYVDQAGRVVVLAWGRDEGLWETRGVRDAEQWTWSAWTNLGGRTTGAVRYTASAGLMDVLTYDEREVAHLGEVGTDYEWGKLTGYRTDHASRFGAIVRGDAGAVDLLLYNQTHPRVSVSRWIGPGRWETRASVELAQYESMPSISHVGRNRAGGLEVFLAGVGRHCYLRQEQADGPLALGGALAEQLDIMGLCRAPGRELRVIAALEPQKEYQLWELQRAQDTWEQKTELDLPPNFRWDGSSPTVTFNAAGGLELFWWTATDYPAGGRRASRATLWRKSQATSGDWPEAWAEVDLAAPPDKGEAVYPHDIRIVRGLDGREALFVAFSHMDRRRHSAEHARLVRRDASGESWVVDSFPAGAAMVQVAGGGFAVFRTRRYWSSDDPHQPGLWLLEREPSGKWTETENLSELSGAPTLGTCTVETAARNASGGLEVCCEVNDGGNCSLWRVRQDGRGGRWTEWKMIIGRRELVQSGCREGCARFSGGWPPGSDCGGERRPGADLLADGPGRAET